MRGSGKTTRLLKATPNGSFYVVQSNTMIQYIRHWLKQTGRNNDGIEVIAVENIRSMTKGRKMPIAIDHCVYESWTTFSNMDLNDLLFYTHNVAPFVLRTDADGDVVTQWNKPR